MKMVTEVVRTIVAAAVKLYIGKGAMSLKYCIH